LPEDRAIGETRIQYKAWADEGWITLTPGNVIDYEYIKQHLYVLKSQCQLTEVSYDPFQATQLAIQLSQEGFPMVEYGMTVRNMSDPMKELDRLIVAEKIHHRGDPVLSWMLSNVVARWDLKDNVFPRKESAEQKIDGAVALIMGIARVDNMIIVPCSAYANLNEAEIFNRMTF
jgi:phage terminase large subunit-like protein